jgi:hypothetical protein
MSKSNQHYQTKNEAFRRRKRSLPKKVLDHGGSFIDDSITIYLSVGAGETHPLPRGGTDFITVGLSVGGETHPLPRGGTDSITVGLSVAGETHPLPRGGTDSMTPDE